MDPVVEDLGRPIEDGQDVARFERAACRRFAPANVQDTVVTKVWSSVVGGEVDDLQVADFVDAQAVAIGNLECCGVSKNCQRPVASRRIEHPLIFEVGEVE